MRNYQHEDAEIFYRCFDIYVYILHHSCRRVEKETKLVVSN